MNTSSSVWINIADFNLHVKSGDGSTLGFDIGFETFLLESDLPNQADIEIHAFDGIPPEVLNPTTLLYTAKTGEATLWEIYTHEDGLQFIVNDPDHPENVQQVAFYNEGKQTWSIYCAKSNSPFVYPLNYPMAPLIMYYLTVEHDAIMVHASGVYDGMEGRIFSGFSGVGKSTMAGIWNERNSMVINDDRLILRKIGTGYWMYNTPMYYKDSRRKTPLNRIYLPYHHPQNKFEALHGVKAVAEFMAFCIQHGYRKKNSSSHFDFISELIQTVPVAKVGVVPTTEIVDFIRKNDDKIN